MAVNDLTNWVNGREKMRICFLGLEIIPQRDLAFYGGLANNVVRISKGLKQHGQHDIHIITSDVNQVLQGPFLTSWGEIHPVKTHSAFVSSLFGMEFFIKAPVEIFKLNSNLKFDLLNIHSAYPILGYISNFSSLSMRIPTVFTLYSPLSSSMRGHGWISRQLSRWSLSNVFLSKNNHIIAVSQNVRQSLMAMGFSEHKIDFIPPIVDTDLFNPSVSPGQGKRRELSLSSDVPIILYCGNWTPWKGVDLLVDSMKRVVKEIPEAKLVLAFGEPIKRYLEEKMFIRNKIINLELESHIIEIGFVQDIKHLIGACNVFVAPFRDTREVADIPLSILEAMACGKPVIATKVGGIPEIIRHCENGFLVEPNNAVELSKAICFLLTNSDIAKDLGNNASRYVLQNYGMNTVSEKIELIYEKLIRN